MRGNGVESIGDCRSIGCMEVPGHSEALREAGFAKG